MVKKLITSVAVGVVLSAVVTGSAFAAANPSGTGQPNVECGDSNATAAPKGFGTSGFANAEQHYANKDGTHAVSQYDVACFRPQH